MVVIPKDLGIFRVRLVFFASDEQLNGLVRSMGWRDVIRVRQTLAVPSIRPLSQGVFRTNCIDLTRDADAILGGMQSRARQYIRAAGKIPDVEIQCNTAGAREDFIRVYNGFVARAGHSAPVSQAWLESVAPFSDIFVISHDGEPMAAHLFVRDREISRVRGLYAGSRRYENAERAKLCATLNRYLHWREILHYKEQGFAWYDFGGIDDLATTHIGQFKLSFGGVILEENTYYFAGILGKIALWGVHNSSRLRSMLQPRVSPN